MSQYLIRPKNGTEYTVEANDYQDMLGKVVELFNNNKIDLSDIIGATAFIQCGGNFSEDIGDSISCNLSDDECDCDCECEDEDREINESFDLGDFIVTIKTKERE